MDDSRVALRSNTELEMSLSTQNLIAALSVRTRFEFLLLESICDTPNCYLFFAVLSVGKVMAF